MFKVYILHSVSCNKFYTGHTQDLDNRFIEHNAGETKSIKRCVPWKLVWQQDLATKGEAMTLENKIKKRGARRFLQNLNIA
jgi:putative endonuclease